MSAKEYHNHLLNFAFLAAKQSTCSRVQVGAALVKNSNVLCVGHNGVTGGTPTCMEIYREKGSSVELYAKYKEDHLKFSTSFELHAEVLLIGHCAKHGIATNECSLYLTVSPCIHCAKLIQAAGITGVIYRNAYDRADLCGVGFLRDHGVWVYQYED